VYPALSAGSPDGHVEPLPPLASPLSQLLPMMSLLPLLRDDA